MKSIKFLLSISILTVSSLVSACGPFTNFPAQYRIGGTSNLTAVVEYPATGATGGSGSGKAKLPKLVLKGEPGSVGATFDTMVIKYNVPDLAQVSMPVSVRIDSSHFRDKDGSVIAESSAVDLPVISPKVITYGSRQGAGNISAQVELNGTDDAGWPTSLTVSVPIVFLQGVSGESNAVNPKP